MNTASPQLIERFWSNVDKSGDCWLWQKSLDSDGYGNFCHDNTTERAHRFSYRLIHEVTPGNQIHHTCRIRHCVNPDHLVETTQSENLYQTRVCMECGNKFTRPE